MDTALRRQWPMTEQDQRISEAIARNQSRLRSFIRKRVPQPGDVEDILQDVFYELVEAHRMMKPVEQVTGWLFRVARNRITDFLRKRKFEELRTDTVSRFEDGEALLLADLLPSREAGPEAAYARSVLLEEIELALEELPEEQRDVFIAHEIDGHSIKEIASRDGVSVNTVLSRKHYAVVHLRQRLRAIYEEFVGRQGTKR